MYSVNATMYSMSAAKINSITAIKLMPVTLASFGLKTLEI
jgi:hypothetical protein